MVTLAVTLTPLASAYDSGTEPAPGGARSGPSTVRCVVPFSRTVTLPAGEDAYPKTQIRKVSGITSDAERWTAARRTVAMNCVDARRKFSSPPCDTSYLWMPGVNAAATVDRAVAAPDLRVGANGEVERVTEQDGR